MVGVDMLRELTQEEQASFNQRAHKIVLETHLDTSVFSEEVIAFINALVDRSNAPFEACVLGLIPYIFTVTQGAKITIREDKNLEFAEPAIAYVLISMLSGSGKSLLCKLLTETTKRVEEDLRRAAEKAKAASELEEDITSPARTSSTHGNGSPSNVQEPEKEEDGFKAPTQGNIIFERAQLLQ